VRGGAVDGVGCVIVRQTLRFAAVGVVATLVHYLVALTLKGAGVLGPMGANAVGFVVAFGVSFLGQWQWTFRDMEAPLRSALPAYFAVAVASFCLNMVLLALLLDLAGLPYPVALGLVVLVVAFISFVVSRLWAFRGGSPGPGAPR
jgi:putative flippase GtrA